MPMPASARHTAGCLTTLPHAPCSAEEEADLTMGKSEELPYEELLMDFVWELPHSLLEIKSFRLIWYVHSSISATDHDYSSLAII